MRNYKDRQDTQIDKKPHKWIKKTDKQTKNEQMDGKRTNGRKKDKWTENRQMDGKMTWRRKVTPRNRRLGPRFKNTRNIAHSLTDFIYEE